MPWIHAADVAGMYLAALDGERWSGPINVSAPEPVTNRAFSKALGSVLHRPAVMPVPSLALRLLYGEMSEIVLTGVRMVPVRALALGYRYRYRELDEALEAALDG
jgi:NAD dependent epimerase/dehydratase family enzyme